MSAVCDDDLKTLLRKEAIPCKKVKSMAEEVKKMKLEEVFPEIKDYKAAFKAIGIDAPELAELVVLGQRALPFYLKHLAEETKKKAKE